MLVGLVGLGDLGDQRLLVASFVSSYNMLMRSITAWKSSSGVVGSVERTCYMHAADLHSTPTSSIDSISTDHAIGPLWSLAAYYLPCSI